MNDEMTFTDAETIRVAAPVIELDIPVCSEVMHALTDPADPDQAVIVNVPVLVDGINYGDIVRLGPEDECGVRPILEVAVASGHVHLLTETGGGEPHELIAALERMFPSYAILVEAASPSVLSVSVHPDVDPVEVGCFIAEWLGAGADSDDYLGLTAPCESELGAVAWPA